MSVDTVLAAGRRAAEALMTTACSITRHADGAWDENVLDYADLDQPVYTGPCRLKFGSSRVSTHDMEGQLLAAQQLVLYLPVAASAGVRIDDIVTVTDGGPDPALTGTSYRVKGLFSQTYATARRLPLESLT